MRLIVADAPTEGHHPYAHARPQGQDRFAGRKRDPSPLPRAWGRGIVGSRNAFGLCLTRNTTGLTRWLWPPALLDRASTRQDSAEKAIIASAHHEIVSCGSATVEATICGSSANGWSVHDAGFLCPVVCPRCARNHALFVPYAPSEGVESASSGDFIDEESVYKTAALHCANPARLALRPSAVVTARPHFPLSVA